MHSNFLLAQEWLHLGDIFMHSSVCLFCHDSNWQTEPHPLIVIRGDLGERVIFYLLYHLQIVTTLDCRDSRKIFFILNSANNLFVWGLSIC